MIAARLLDCRTRHSRFRFLRELFYNSRWFGLHPLGVRSRPTEMAPLLFVWRAECCGVDDSVHFPHQDCMQNLILWIRVDEEMNSPIEARGFLKRRIGCHGKRKYFA